MKEDSNSPYVVPDSVMVRAREVARDYSATDDPKKLKTNLHSDGRIDWLFNGKVVVSIIPTYVREEAVTSFDRAAFIASWMEGWSQTDEGYAEQLQAVEYKANREEKKVKLGARVPVGAWKHEVVIAP